MLIQRVKTLNTRLIYIVSLYGVALISFIYLWSDFYTQTTGVFILLSAWPPLIVFFSLLHWSLAKIVGSAKMEVLEEIQGRCGQYSSQLDSAR